MEMPTDAQLKQGTAAFWRGRKLVKEGTWTKKGPAPAGWMEGGDDLRTTVLPQKLEEACAVYREAIADFMMYDLAGELATTLEKLGKHRDASQVWLEAASTARRRQHNDKIAAMEAAAARVAKKDGKAEWMMKPLATAPKAAQRDVPTPETLALEFAEALMAGRFEVAHAMLTSAARKELSPAQLRKRYAKMIAHFDSPASTADVEEIITEGDPLKAGDVAWIYVSITGEDDPEAVTLTITEEGGKPLIRDVEWGRP